MIKLNVGGVVFETSKDVLNKSAYFKTMLEDCDHTSDNIIFVDRSAHIFKHVLAYLRDDTYLYPIKYEKELQYFLINYTKFVDPIEKIYREIKNIKSALDDINYIQDRIGNMDIKINNLSEQINTVWDNKKPNNCKYPDCTNCCHILKVCADHIEQCVLCGARTIHPRHLYCYDHVQYTM